MIHNTDEKQRYITHAFKLIILSLALPGANNLKHYIRLWCRSLNRLFLKCFSREFCFSPANRKRFRFQSIINIHNRTTIIYTAFPGAPEYPWERRQQNNHGSRILDKCLLVLSFRTPPEAERPARFTKIYNFFHFHHRSKLRFDRSFGLFGPSSYENFYSNVCLESPCLLHRITTFVTYLSLVFWRKMLLTLICVDAPLKWSLS